MTKLDIELRCRKKADELLQKYFPHFVQDAAVNKPEVLDPEFRDMLPQIVASEFQAWLASFWAELVPEKADSFDEGMNLRKGMEVIHADYEDIMPAAREKAQCTSFLKRLFKTNHKNVTYYKGLLKQYTEELLDTMVRVFVEEVPEQP